MAEGSPTSPLHLSTICWIAGNFYLCQECTVPRWLLYELYTESCSLNSRCHYNGIAIKNNSSFYTCYCSLLLYRLPMSGYSHCQDIVHMMRKSELDKVEDCIMSFWRSLQPERIALMSLPDVCQLFKSYDRQLFKEMEKILLHDFLEEAPVQHIESITLFSQNAELRLLNALKEFPLPLQTSKSKEVTVFMKRCSRKIDLSNRAKFSLRCALNFNQRLMVNAVLNSNSKITVLRSDLHAVIDQRFLDVRNLFQTKFRKLEELENDIEFKCLNDLISLAPSTDIPVLLNCVSSHLAFVIQIYRSKEEFRKLDFQLRWNFLLSAVSKAMTFNYTDSFGSWHLFHLLLMDFVAHIFLSYTEEEGDDSFWVTKQNESSVLRVHERIHLGLFCRGATSSQCSTGSFHDFDAEPE
ncbi:LOW QUALITY PROTEIN: DNA-binding protein RFX8 [Chlamydotis macqueenii]